MIMKADFRHRGRIKKIAAVENNRSRHFFFYRREIDVRELGPLCRDNKRFRVYRRLEWALAKPGAFNRAKFAGTLHSLGIINRNTGALPQHVRDQIKRDG